MLDNPTLLAVGCKGPVCLIACPRRPDVGSLSERIVGASCGPAVHRDAVRPVTASGRRGGAVRGIVGADRRAP